MSYLIKPEEKTPLPHYWEMCVGSCHAATALRADYREQLKQAHEELGFRYVRFHGLFDDDMSVVLYDSPSPYMPSDKVKYNFMNTDNIFDFLVSIGMKPFLELGFMPRLLASGNQTTFAYAGNITPPKDYDQWADFIEAFTRHAEERYGADEVSTWFFEVWNEPNLPSFWTGTQEEYFKLYAYTARAIKKVNPGFQVGGPATSINAWIPEFRSWCAEHDVPVDFISTHHYPTDDPMWNNPGMDLMAILAEKGMDAMSKYDKHIMRKMTRRARKEAGELPLYYTEWNVSALMGDGDHDIPYAAATIARILHENIGMVEGYSWWTFSDIFEEMGQMLGEFQGGFGLMTYHGVKKPSYRLFELLHELGTEQLAVESADEDTDSNVGILAAEKAESIQLLVYNQNTKALGQIETETVRIQLPMASKPSVSVRRIDEEHGNVHRAWKAMGSPLYVSAGQLKTLHDASRQESESLDADFSDGMAELSVEMPPYSVALLTIHK